MKKLFFTFTIVTIALCSNAQWETANDVGSTKILYHNWDGGAPEAIIRGYENGSTAYGRIRLGRALGTTEYPDSGLEDDDILGQIFFQGYHDNFLFGAAIQAHADGIVNASSMPGRLEFRTTPLYTTTLATRMTIDHLGHVGIGTTSPSAMIDIENGGSNCAIDINMNHTNDPKIRFQLGGTSKFTMGIDNSDDDKFKIGTEALETNTRLTIDESGNVGIGTTTPTALLNVDGSAVFNENHENYDFRVETNTSSYAFFIDSRASGDEEIVVNWNENATLNFRVAGLDGTTNNERLIWADAGLNAVGILTDNLQDGTTTYRLSVDGKIRCEELKVYDSDDWGDYVFEEDYDLADLKEVEEYIKDNKHLPGIPSAKEIEENGLVVGELIKLQMVKIEELTLHLIKQEREIEALKAQMSNR